VVASVAARYRGGTPRAGGSRPRLGRPAPFGGGRARGCDEWPWLPGPVPGEL